MKKRKAAAIFLVIVAVPFLAWQFWLNTSETRTSAIPPVVAPVEVTAERSGPAQQITANPRPGGAVLTVNFSYYCDPEPKLTYQVENKTIIVKPEAQEKPVTQCVKPYNSAINLENLEPGSYTIVWKGDGTMPPIAMVIPE